MLISGLDFGATLGAAILRRETTLVLGATGPGQIVGYPIVSLARAKTSTPTSTPSSKS